MNIDKLSIELLLALSAIILRGEIAPYAASPDFQNTLSQHRLTAWTHLVEAESVPIPFLLYRPSLPKNSAPVPLLVFLPAF